MVEGLGKCFASVLAATVGVHEQARRGPADRNGPVKGGWNQVRLASARARGRRRDLSEEAERTAIVAETLYREQQLGAKEMAQRLRISKVTRYK